VTCPPAVQAAVRELGPIPCPDVCGVVELGYDAERDRLVIKHPYAACECATDPEGPAASGLARAVLEDLALLVAVGHYGEEPVNEWSVAA
jgi:hypothetical protein